VNSQQTYWGLEQNWDLIKNYNESKGGIGEGLVWQNKMSSQHNLLLISWEGLTEYDLLLKTDMIKLAVTNEIKIYNSNYAAMALVCSV